MFSNIWNKMACSRKKVVRESAINNLISEFEQNLSMWSEGECITSDELRTALSRWVNRDLDDQKDRVIISDHLYDTSTFPIDHRTTWDNALAMQGQVERDWSEHYDCDDFAANFKVVIHKHYLKKYYAYIDSIEQKDLTIRERIAKISHIANNTPQACAVGLIHFVDKEVGPHVVNIIAYTSKADDSRITKIVAFDATRNAILELTQDELSSINAIYF